MHFFLKKNKTKVCMYCTVLYVVVMAVKYLVVVRRCDIDMSAMCRISLQKKVPVIGGARSGGCYKT